MSRTQQIQCCLLILNFLLQVSSLHYPASWPRNIPWPCKLLPCFMRPAGQDSLPVRNAPQAVGFRCSHCSCEFYTRSFMDCHRRKKSSLGTGCAGPNDSKSVSFTGRASITSSIVWEHDFLCAHPNHMERVCVHRQLLPMTPSKNIVVMK